MYNVELKELKNDDWVVVFKSNKVELNDIHGILISHINRDGLLPNAIMHDVREHGMAGCQCGSIGVAYNISLIKD